MRNNTRMPNPTPPISLPPEPWWGVTVDNVERLAEIEEALTGFRVPLITRIVFDGDKNAAYYRKPLEMLRKKTYVMGEIWDSFDFKKCTVEMYKQRTADFYSTVGDLVDVWEIGNEVNGEWAGEIQDIVDKVSYAGAYLKGKKATTALTLFYNPNSFSKPECEMFRWVDERVKQDLKDNSDYVLLSYYQDQCNDYWPDWNEVFHEVAKRFPGKKLGFGEVGTAKGDKQAFLKRYYPLKVDVPGYMGGYFWWFFNQDMLPKTRPLWQSIHDVIAP